MYELTKLYSPDQAIDRTLQFNLKQVFEHRADCPPKWLYPDHAVRLLRTLPFFKRLSERTLLEHLEQMPLVEKKQSELLFPDLSVIIILNGRVILRRHERNPLDYKTLASYQAGQILGFDQGDDGLCKDCDMWVAVVSKFV